MVVLFAAVENNFLFPKLQDELWRPPDLLFNDY
jgi:hypothetical protein